MTDMTTNDELKPGTLIEGLRASAKAFRENTVYDSEGDPIRLIAQADEADEAARTIEALTAERDLREDQIDELANFIMAEVPGEPSRSEGAVECAIRIIREVRAERDRLAGEVAEYSSVLLSAARFVEALADNDPDEPIADNGMTVLGMLQFQAPALALAIRAALTQGAA